MAMLAWPLATAPWLTKDALHFVRNGEKRQPAAWPEIDHAGDLLASQTWGRVNQAINDRTPLRGELTEARRHIEIGVLGEREFGQVGIGRDGWLFYLPELGALTGTVAEVDHALAAYERARAEHGWSARVVLVAAPDKNSIYPEMLSAPLRDLLRPHLAKRQRIRDWFRQPGTPDRLDTWSYYERAKSGAIEPIYEPTGSHHSSLGSMHLAHAMIDAADPTLWDWSRVVHTETLVYQSDLSTMAGFVNRTESWDRYEVRRPGVETIAFVHNGTLMPEGVDRPPAAPRANDLPARYVNRSDDAELIPGRTLVVHDSFIAGYLRPTLSRFFADVTFVHANLLTPGDLQDALNDFDLVYLECAERGIRPFLQGYFSVWQPPGEGRVLDMVRLPGE